jgi:hypothetical protein
VTTAEGLGSRDRVNGRPTGTLADHRNALIRRLRFEYVGFIINEAVLYANQDKYLEKELSPRDVARIIAERSQASDRVTTAALIARDRFPRFTKTVQPETIERDYRVVRDAMSCSRDKRRDRQPSRWPGPYYLPTKETCDRLDWQDISQSFHDIGIAHDGPRAVIS